MIEEAGSSPKVAPDVEMDSPENKEVKPDGKAKPFFNYDQRLEQYLQLLVKFKMQNVREEEA